MVATASGGPAATSGMLAGDLIVAVNDRVVTSVDDLHRLISDFGKQPLLALTIVRDKHLRELAVRPVVSD